GALGEETVDLDRLSLSIAAGKIADKVLETGAGSDEDVAPLVAGEGAGITSVTTMRFCDSILVPAAQEPVAAKAKEPSSPEKETLPEERKEEPSREAQPKVVEVAP